MRKHYTDACSNHPVYITQGRGPHAYQLKCSHCDKHLQWLSRQQAVKLMATLIEGTQDVQTTTH